jgi:hypothetical protein
MHERIYNVLFPCTGNSAIDKLSLGTRLRNIGRGEGATTSRPDVA